MAYYAAVRYGLHKAVGGFLSTIDGLRRGNKVVLLTERGVELGELLRTWDKEIPVDLDVPMVGEVLRKASEKDVEKHNELNAQKIEDTRKYVFARIMDLGLAMKVVGVEHVMGGEKIVFYFLAEGRVDFRDLVKDLAKRFRTRIEMRQIGVRDEAKICGDCEYSCGLTLCCSTHLRKLAPVTMRMAKNQMRVLDPNRVTGRCGRLRCCLRYEDDTYTDLKKEMPLMGSRVRWEGKEGDIIDRMPVKSKVMVEEDTGDRFEANFRELTVIKPGYEENLEANNPLSELRSFRQKSAEQDGRELYRYGSRKMSATDFRGRRQQQGSQQSAAVQTPVPSQPSVEKTQNDDDLEENGDMPEDVGSADSSESQNDQMHVTESSQEQSAQNDLGTPKPEQGQAQATDHSGKPSNLYRGRRRRGRRGGRDRKRE